MEAPDEKPGGWKGAAREGLGTNGGVSPPRTRGLNRPHRVKEQEAAPQGGERGRTNNARGPRSPTVAHAQSAASSITSLSRHTGNPSPGTGSQRRLGQPESRLPAASSLARTPAAPHADSLEPPEAAWPHPPGCINAIATSGRVAGQEDVIPHHGVCLWAAPFCTEACRAAVSAPGSLLEDRFQLQRFNFFRKVVPF